MYFIPKYNAYGEVCILYLKMNILPDRVVTNVRNETLLIHEIENGNREYVKETTTQQKSRKQQVNPAPGSGLQLASKQTVYYIRINVFISDTNYIVNA